MPYKKAGDMWSGGKQLVEIMQGITTDVRLDYKAQVQEQEENDETVGSLKPREEIKEVS